MPAPALASIWSGSPMLAMIGTDGSGVWEPWGGAFSGGASGGGG